MATETIYAALAKAQATMKNPAMDSVNPHFKNRYASLLSVREAVLPPLNEHGIAVVQWPVSAFEDGRVLAGIATTLVHTSGEKMESVLLLPVEKPNAQGVGSAITYARRYALLALAGLVGDPDDDGNEASAPPAQPQRAAAAKPTAQSPGQLLVALVGQWTGITDQNDLNSATRKAIERAGVELKKGEKLTPEQLELCRKFVGTHKNWQEALA